MIAPRLNLYQWKETMVEICRDDWDSKVLAGTEPWSRREIWADLLVRSNGHDRVVLTQADAARRWKRSRGWVLRFLQDMVGAGLITAESSRGRGGHTELIIKKAILNASDKKGCSQEAGIQRSILDIHWNKEKRGIDATPEFRQIFFKRWRKHFTAEQIRVEMTRASRLLDARPESRGSGSQIEVFLHNYMERALEEGIKKGGDDESDD